MIRFNNVGVRIEIIPVKDFFGYGREGIFISINFHLFDVIIVFVVSVILVIEIGTREVLTEAFITSCAFVVVAVIVLEVDAAVGNHGDIFWYWRDR